MAERAEGPVVSALSGEASSEAVRRMVAVGHLKRCEGCGGLGWVGHWFGGPFYRLDTCPECRGRGKTVWFAQWDGGRV